MGSTWLHQVCFEILSTPPCPGTSLVCLNAGVDCRIIVWDISTASQVCELRGHTDTVYQLAYSRDGTILASGGLDQCVKLWDTSCFEENGVTMNPLHW